MSENGETITLHVLDNDYSTLSGVTLIVYYAENLACASIIRYDDAIHFTPNSFFFGNCTIIYSISDGVGGISSNANAIVIVNQGNHIFYILSTFISTL